MRRVASSITACGKTNVFLCREYTFSKHYNYTGSIFFDLVKSVKSIKKNLFLLNGFIRSAAIN